MYMYGPWTTKPVIRVNFSKIIFDIDIYQFWSNYLKTWNLRVQKNLYFAKIAFNAIYMKFLAMHITNQKLSFDTFTVGNLQNIFMEHDLYLTSIMIFGIKEKYKIQYDNTRFTTQKHFLNIYTVYMCVCVCVCVCVCTYIRINIHSTHTFM